ncbi:MAG: AbrB/MazE/SpoVT family DNA-binding domain-containing protein [Alphaproteobacteria bacterium]
MAKIGPGGRIVIPALVRRAMGLKVGDRVVLRFEEDGELRIISQRVAIKRAQELVRRYFPGEGRLSDLLIAQRRAEAAREDQEL